MSMNDFDFYVDVSGLNAATDPVPATIVALAGTLDLVGGLPSGTVISNDTADQTNVTAFTYNEYPHGDQVSIAVRRARTSPDDGSDSTVAVIVGGTGEVYGFSSSSFGIENCYVCRRLGENLVIFRCVNGTLTSIGLTNTTITLTDNEDWEFHVVPDGSDNLLSVEVNGSVVWSFTDTTPPDFGGYVPQVAFKGQDNLNSSFYAFAVDGLAQPEPTVTSINTDNTGDQYEAVTAEVTNFAGNITSFVLDDGENSSAGVVVDGDIADGTVSLRLPGDLPTGTYAATLSNATESASISFDYTQTHPANIPAGLYDSRSILNGQGLGESYAGDVWMDNPGAPYEIDGEGGTAVVGGEVMSFKAPYTDWTDVPLQNSVDDYLAAPTEFLGWMRQDFVRLYPDGTTDTWSAEFEITAAVTIEAVTVPADGTYGLAAELLFVVQTTRPVDVTGNPRLALDLQGSTRYATYVSGSGTNELLFSYTVQSGDYAPNGVDVNGLQLNGGAITDEMSRGIDLALNGVGDTSAVLAGTPPHQLVSIDGETVGTKSANISVSYPGTNITGYEYNIGAGWVATSNPIQLNGLDGGTPYDYDVRPVNEFGEGSPTSDSFTTTAGTDTTPNPFSFAPAIDQPLSSRAISEAITITGVDAGQDVPVVVTDGEWRYSTDGGESWTNWTSAPGNVRLNYQVQQSHITSDEYSSGGYDGVRSSTLEVGGETAVFQSTTVPDTVKPVISLVGGNVEHIQGTPWVDPGFSATDNTGEAITVNPGVPDINALGPQTVPYTATDSSGNTGTASRIVTVVEETPVDPSGFLLSPQRFKLSLS